MCMIPIQPIILITNILFFITIFNNLLSLFNIILYIFMNIWDENPWMKKRQKKR